MLTEGATGPTGLAVSVCNWQTSERDVARAIAAVSRVLQQKKR